jgi:hypothetical protein
MPFIKDLIHIPEQVQSGDFVLKLADGVNDAEQTLRDYVVTPQLAKCFADALNFIKSTVDTPQIRSKGAYLHGSFGTGKSHFMAVLHLLLQGNPLARGVPELAESVSKHDEWMGRKNILLVPYHMIGAQNLEDGILGGYAKYIQQKHPDAPLPGFYLYQDLFADAVTARQSMGDEAFFNALNAGAPGGDDGWGDLDSGWDAASFEAALVDEACEETRQRLVSALVGSLFKSYTKIAGGAGFVNFDDGLSAMCRHAKALGYDAVILFLDELILWLASRLSDQAFISTEIQKVVKLVESGQSRALPLVSFIARQRDLREFIGEDVTGAEQEVLSDSLKYWEGRFHTITLEDRNLPVIAQKRLLRPLSGDAHGQLDAAFATTGKMRAELFDVLLTTAGDREMFRQVYPFSLALIQALVALSSALQRERTSLKVMLMLLVQQRNTLQLGQLIPVGDLYDVIASEVQPFSPSIGVFFEHAQKLWQRKLVPLLENEHGVVYRELDNIADDAPGKKALLNDARLLKTLLLAALAPQVECFRQLTPTKLVALNHGSIKSPIPGRERQMVLQKCGKWAGQVGEIKITDDADNPTIGIQLTGVDTESIVEQARVNDSIGNRKKLFKELVFEAFGIEDKGGLFIEHSLTWRGTRRSVDIVFANVRELSFEQLDARGETWKFIVDFPFDEGNHTPMSDMAHIETYQDAGRQAKTVCWLPYFFTQDIQTALGKLVVLEYVLKNDERFSGFTRHLSPLEKSEAKILLENQRSQLRQRLRNIMDGAYGIAQEVPHTLDKGAVLESQLVSLDKAFRPAMPTGMNMREAFDNLVAQALAKQFPGHPEFATEIKPTVLGKVLEELRKAVHAENGRIGVADKSLRDLLRQVAQPLELGVMHENHFVLSPDWMMHFQRELAKQSGLVTVKRLYDLTDEPKARGLPTEVKNLLVLLFAEHGQYAFEFNGAPYPDTPELKNLPDSLTLVHQALPDTETWRKAVEMAGAVFGGSASTLLNATNVSKFQVKLAEDVNGFVGNCSRLPGVLTAYYDKLGVDKSGNRLRTAQAAEVLLHELQNGDGEHHVVKTLAECEIPTSPQALGTSVKSAEAINKVLEETNWALLEGVWNNPEHQAAGEKIRHHLQQALLADEFVIHLEPALKQAIMEATKVLTKKPEPPPPSPPPKGKKIKAQDSKQGLLKNELVKEFKAIEQAVGDGKNITVNLTWEVIEKM